MKRAFIVMATAAAVVSVVVPGPTSARACQYCRMALEDPEAARLITHDRGGSSALEASLSQYQAAPVSADLKTAPATSSVATSASALIASGADGRQVSVVRRPVLPPPPLPLKAAAVPAKIPDARVDTGVVRWTDVCLLSLAAAGGIFCWRTRRTAAAAKF